MNEKFYPYLWNTDRYLVNYGSSGSGKSHFKAQKIAYRLFNEDVGHRFLVLRKYSPDLVTSAFALIKDYIIKWGLWNYCHCTVKPMYIHNNINGNEIYFRGLDDMEKIKSIEGLTGIWYEESTEASYQDVLQLDLRLRPTFKDISFIDEKGIPRKRKATVRDGAYAQIMFSYNPISKQKWTYKHHHLENKPSYRKKVQTEIEYRGKKEIITSYLTVVHSTYKDNKFLSPEYVASLEELINKDPVFYKIYCKGEYADLKNKIYNNYHIVDSFPDIEFEKSWCGLDFGYIHPTALTKINKKGDKRYLKQLFYKSGYDTTQFIEWLDKVKFSKNMMIYADNAEPDRIQQIKKAGYNIKPAYKGKNSVLAGIDYCKSLTIYILKKDKELREEFYSYKFKEDNDGDIVFDSNGNEMPVKFKDDGLDAWRYAEYTYYIEGDKIPSCRAVNY